MSTGEVDVASLVRAVGHDGFAAMVGPADDYSLDELEVHRIDGRPVWSATLSKWWEEYKAPQVVGRWSIAGAAVHATAPAPAKAYRARPEWLPEPRDGWAALLADAADAVSQPPEPYLSAAGWVVASAPSESPVPADAVAAVAASYDALLTRRGMPATPTAPTMVDPPPGFPSRLVNFDRGYDRTARFAEVEHQGRTPARLLRRHVRESCGPQIGTQLIVTWPRAASPGLESIAEYPTLVPKAGVAPGLLTDVDVAGLRLNRHLGDRAPVVSAVRWIADGVAFVGVDDADGRGDDAVIAAAAQTMPALPAICQSPGIDFALAQQLVSARIQRRARRSGNGTEPRGFRIRSDMKMNYLITEGWKTAILAWASRPVPGGTYHADVTDGRVLVRADHAPEFGGITATLQKHASAISPSSWFVTPQLVFAHSDSAPLAQMRGVFHALNLLVKS